METKSKIIILLGLIAVLVLGVIIGYGGQNINLGKDDGKQKLSKEEMQKLINAAYPTPPEQVFGFSGTIKEVKDNQISLEIYNPDDYLPTDDRRRELRTVIVTDKTAIYETDYGQLNKDGSLVKTALKISDLKVDQKVTVTSSTDIKYAKSFEAKDIARAK